jgi:hypothetical protein
VTRRDYIFLADSFADTYARAKSREAKVAIAQAAADMADNLARHNPSFDSHLFMQNAGMIGGNAP